MRIPPNLPPSNVGNVQGPANSDIWNQISTQWSQLVTDIGNDTRALNPRDKQAIESKIQQEAQHLFRLWDRMSDADKTAFTNAASKLISGYRDAGGQEPRTPQDLYEDVWWSLSSFMPKPDEEPISPPGFQGIYNFVNNNITNATDLQGNEEPTDFNTLFTNVLKEAQESSS
jgi:hypothetical protein